MNFEPVNLGDELGQGIEARLDLPPVVVGLPMVHELAHGRERHALGIISNGLLLGPSYRRQAPTEIIEILLRDIDAEWADRFACGGRR
jgi:hypothetical protein